jgi:hypothetical protein
MDRRAANGVEYVDRRADANKLGNTILLSRGVARASGGPHHSKVQRRVACSVLCVHCLRMNVGQHRHHAHVTLSRSRVQRGGPAPVTPHAAVHTLAGPGGAAPYKRHKHFFIPAVDRLMNRCPRENRGGVLEGGQPEASRGAGVEGVKQVQGSKLSRHLNGDARRCWLYPNDNCHDKGVEERHEGSVSVRP